MHQSRFICVAYFMYSWHWHSYRLVLPWFWFVWNLRYWLHSIYILWILIVNGNFFCKWRCFRKTSTVERLFCVSSKLRASVLWLYTKKKLSIHQLKSSILISSILFVFIFRSINWFWCQYKLCAIRYSNPWNYKR